VQPGDAYVPVILWLSCAWIGASDLDRRLDADRDGHDAVRWDGDDCDDGDPAVHPGASETWYDGTDADCDGANDWDQDGDGVRVEGDCNDTDPAVFPSAPEVVNGIDDDCDGETDEIPTTDDLDGDGWTEAGGDCDDDDPDVHPGAAEIWYDGHDQDCDPLTEYDRDGDGDDWDGAGGDDCDDGDPDVHPGAIEEIDGIDNNCDGFTL
jgi:hypothetical protein